LDEEKREGGDGDVARSLAIRKEINRLKEELRAIEQPAAVEVQELGATSAVCGHDEIMSSLRGSARAVGNTGAAALAAFDDSPEHGSWFYSTTFVPRDLTHYLSDATGLVRFLATACETGALELLHRLWKAAEANSADPRKPCSGSRRAGDPRGLASARELDLVTPGEPPQLSEKGTRVLIVLAHLYYVSCIKPDPRVSLEMIPVLKEVLGVDYLDLDYLDLEVEDAVSELRAAGVLNELAPSARRLADLRALLAEMRAPSRARTAEAGASS
jgi:hypothetical protein